MSNDSENLKESSVTNDGCYKLSWRERISFCTGDVAQNIYSLPQPKTQRNAVKVGRKRKKRAETLFFLFLRRLYAY